MKVLNVKDLGMKILKKILQFAFPLFLKCKKMKFPLFWQHFLEYGVC